MGENNLGLEVSADSVGLPAVEPRHWHHHALQHLGFRHVGAAGCDAETGLGVGDVREQDQCLLHEGKKEQGTLFS